MDPDDLVDFLIHVRELVTDATAINTNATFQNKLANNINK